jgi:hypothetical protein
MAARFFAYVSEIRRDKSDRRQQPLISRSPKVEKVVDTFGAGEYDSFIHGALRKFVSGVK